MAHVTSTWARIYGLTDPDIKAQEVQAASAHQMVAITTIMTRLGVLCDGLAEQAHASEKRLLTLWSTPNVRVILADLRDLWRALADHIRQQTHHLDEFVKHIEQQQAAITQAYRSADSIIASEGLGRSLASVPPEEVARIERRRCSVVRSIGVATTAASYMLAQAAQLLAEIYRREPQQYLPTRFQRLWNVSGNKILQTTVRNTTAALSADLSSPDPDRRQFAQQVLQSLDQFAAEHSEPVSLLEYSYDYPAGQGSVAFVIGNVAQASSVATLVPGVANSPSSLAGLANQTLKLYRDMQHTADGKQVAMIAWMGYDLPASWVHDRHTQATTMAGIVNDSFIASNAIKASQAGKSLAAFSGKIRQLMAPGADHTLMGHSYGASVVSEGALHTTDPGVIDNLVLMAAPGAGFGVRDVDSYPAVKPENVYALAYSLDPVTSPMLDEQVHKLLRIVQPDVAQYAAQNGGPFGVDPLTQEFGARVIDTPTNRPTHYPNNPLPMAAALALNLPFSPVRSPTMSERLKHHEMDNYLANESLHAMSAIATGRYSQVPVRGKGN